MTGAMTPRCVALSGGVGGAKLALGLDRVMEPGSLLVIANTGDDFDHFGLVICPDIDTVVYTLAGVANPQTGWGRADEGWRVMQTLDALGGQTWFRLGDRDVALHLERTQRLRDGETLSQITTDFRRRFKIASQILPMSDHPVRTVVETPDGPLPFQQYFVREQCAPVVTGFRFEGAAEARPAPGLLDALAGPDVEVIVICPSNPFISIDPILATSGLRDAISASAAPVVAVSPIVGGRAIKGPTAKMMRELGLETDAVAVARHYADFVDGFILDECDAAAAPQVRALGMEAAATKTVMNDLGDREALARFVFDFAGRLRS
jgi:LPPG:FO 2-phospho-L-lactate transferase